ncbi:MAG: hypothetical protein OQJ89_09005 [Kangiellaceae bacterium]|nr:hypothetical protein [Kangiellaceae bacterium]MCW9017089.1 hypothetical protein [Kangiellaceae bacterium]
MEIDIPKKLGLWWSKSWLEDQDGKVVASSDYLYMPERFSECFWVLFERLNYTHDYCLHQLVSSEEKLRQLREDAKECPDIEDHYYWEYNVDVISKSNVLMIMSSFIEWGLKRVLKELVGSIPKKGNKRTSDIDHYITCIKSEALIDLDLAPRAKSCLNALRKLRNKFAHGEWEKIEPLLKDLTFKEMFTCISDLFSQIENLAWESEWGNV